MCIVAFGHPPFQVNFVKVSSTNGFISFSIRVNLHVSGSSYEGGNLYAELKYW